MNIAAIVSSLVFLASLGMIYTEKINRTIVAFAGATVMLVVGRVFLFYTMEDAVEAIDFETLALLLSMMILFTMLEPTGFFEYLAVISARASKGNPITLFVLLGVVTAVVSMFLNNVTTVVLIAPVTILLSEILGVSPVPYLLAEALFSNIGGVATLVGDPPNVLIGSAAGFSFNDFLIHSLPTVSVVLVGGIILMRILFRTDLSVQPKSIKSILELNPAEALNEPEIARKVMIVLAGAIFLFFIHRSLGVGPAFVSILAAAAALWWINPDMDEALKRVEWGVLIFFGSLFIMVGGLEAAGVLDLALGLLKKISHLDPMIFGVVIIWVTAILSALVDNIPITIALIPILEGLGRSGVNVMPLWWALAFGVGFGGNGTIIGSSAGIVVTALSEKTHYPITPALWNRRGLPLMALSCFISSILFVILYKTF